MIGQVVTLESRGAAAADPVSIDALPARLREHIVVAESGCWIWTGRTDRDGYGRLGRHGVHRLVYQLLAGPIPEDRPILDHVLARGCTSRACCWPAHLEPVTHRENVLRGQSFAALNAVKTACDHGHDYDPANTYWRPNGHRDCRRCTVGRQRRYKRRQRDAAERRVTARATAPRTAAGRPAA